MAQPHSKPIRNHPLPPIKLFQQTFCKNCPYKNQCPIDSPRFHHCILTLLADELARLRQTIQHTTQHGSW